MKDVIQELFDLGARFILCKLEKGHEKEPIGNRNEIYTKRRKSVNQVLNHLKKGGYVGIEPYSLGFAVVDSDGKKGAKEVKVHNTKLAQSLLKFMGTKGFLGGFGSLSDFENGSGKTHLWFKIDTSDESPLGVKSSGEPYKAAPTDMQFGSEDTGFDIRYKNSYVVCHQYFDKILARLKERSNLVANDNWDKIIPRGHEYKQVKTKEAIYRRANAKYISTISLPSKGDGQHNVASELGYKVGRELHFNPWFEEQARKWLEEEGLDDSRWKSFDDGVKEGEENPKMEESTQSMIILKSAFNDGRFNEIMKHLNLMFRYNGALDVYEYSEDQQKNWSILRKDYVRVLHVTAHDRFLISKKGKDDSTELKPFKMNFNEFEARIFKASEENKHNIIKDFLGTIPEYKEEWGDLCWEIFKKFGIEDTPLNRWASKQIWVGAYYYNAYEDYIPLRPIIVLAGPQDIGKTAVIREMFPAGNFRNRLHGPHITLGDKDKEKIESIMGRMLVEAGEMQNQTKKGLESYKAFSQRTMDGNVRLAYRKNATHDLKRTAWIVGTSNKIDCLPNDDTVGEANTRFLVMECKNGFAVEKFMKENRMKIWAQIKRYVDSELREKGDLRMPRELIEARNESSKKHVQTHDLMKIVVLELTHFVDNLNKDFVKRGYNLKELMNMKPYTEYKGSNRDLSVNTHNIQNEFKNALASSGYWVYKSIRIGYNSPAKKWIRTDKVFTEQDIVSLPNDLEPF